MLGIFFRDFLSFGIFFAAGLHENKLDEDLAPQQPGGASSPSGGREGAPI